MIKRCYHWNGFILTLSLNVRKAVIRKDRRQMILEEDVLQVFWFEKKQYTHCFLALKTASVTRAVPKNSVSTTLAHFRIRSILILYHTLSKYRKLKIDLSWKYIWVQICGTGQFNMEHLWNFQTSLFVQYISNTISIVRHGNLLRQKHQPLFSTLNAAVSEKHDISNACTATGATICPAHRLLCKDPTMLQHRELFKCEKCSRTYEEQVS